MILMLCYLLLLLTLTGFRGIASSRRAESFRPEGISAPYEGKASTWKPKESRCAMDLALVLAMVAEEMVQARRVSTRSAWEEQTAVG